MVDESKLNAFIGKMLGDLGGAFSVPRWCAWAISSASTRPSKSRARYAARTRGEDESRRTLRARVAVASGVVRLSRVHTSQRASSPCRRNRRWCSRTLTAQSICKGLSISRWRWWKTRRKSRPHFVQAKASAGAIRRRACSAPWDGSSARAITTISADHRSGPGRRRCET